MQSSKRYSFLNNAIIERILLRFDKNILIYFYMSEIKKYLIILKYLSNLSVGIINRNLIINTNKM